MWFRYLRAPYLGGVALIAAGAAMAGMASDAEAALALRLTQGATVVTVADGGGSDLDPTVGIISYNSTLSGDVLGSFVTNISTGSSNPVLPPPYPHMDLSTVQISSNGGGTIEVALSQDGFDSMSAVQSFTSAWGVVMNAGQSAFEAYVDPSDALFSKAGTKVADFSASSPGGFFINAAYGVPVSPSYSVSLYWTITHTGAGITTGNANLQIPEPGSLALLGIGLMGMGGLILRRRRLVTQAAA